MSLYDLPMTKIENPVKDNKLPYVTHEGVLNIEPLFKSIKVYQLSDGKRVVPKECLDELFGVDFEEVMKIAVGL